MKVKKFNHIKNIRNFFDFDANEVYISEYTNGNNEIKKVANTVIYAPNGTGKTNISRLLEYISIPDKNIQELLSKEALRDGKKLSFSIDIDGTEINETNYKESAIQSILNNLHIFNSDYIQENIKCDDFSEKNIEGTITMPVGKENIKVNDLEKSIHKLTTEREDKHTQLKKLISTETEKHKKKYTGSHPSIWSEFNISKIIDEKYIITEPSHISDFKDCEDKFSKIKGYSAADKITFSTNIISDEKTKLIVQVYDILKTSKAFTEFNETIEADINEITKKWIDQDLLQKGIKESEEAKKCLLCKRDLDISVELLFLKYKEFFDNEKGKFNSKIELYKKGLETLKTELEKINNNQQSKTEEMIATLGVAGSWKSLLTEELISEIDELIGKLDTKKEDPSNTYEPTKNLKSLIENLNEKIKNDKELIGKINSKIDNSSTEETELRKIIGKMFLYNFFTENKSLFEDIKKITDNIKTDGIELAKEKANLPKLDIKSNIVKLFNQFLHDFIGLNKYSSDIIEETICLKLENENISKETHRISEGEKNMIGLCYYLASSIQKFGDIDSLKKAIYIIDDPICSTSYGNFFGICNLLNNYEKYIFKTLGGNDSNKVGQKVILTHNTQFLNMIRNNIFKDKNGLYFILNNKTLKEIPKQHLISEFETSLCRIYEATENKDYCLNIGNDIRRFFETLRHFYGYKEFNSDALLKIFPSFNQNEHTEFYMAVNYYSHGNPEGHTDPLPPENIEKILKQFVVLIEHDNSLFNEMWKNMIKRFYTD